MIFRILCLTTSIFIFISISLGQEIFKAVEKGDLNKIDSIIKKDKSALNVRDEDGNTLLTYAVYYKQLKALELLVERGLDINTQNRLGWSPIYTACARCDLELIKFLIEKGADINATHIEMGMPADFAYAFCNDEVNKFLISKGAKYTAVKLEKIHLSKNIYRIAFRYCHLTNIIVSSGPDGILLVDAGFSKLAVPEIKKLLEEFKNPNIKYVINTHLHWDHRLGNIIVEDTNKILNYKTITQKSLPSDLKKVDDPITGKTGKFFPYYYSMSMNGENIKIIPYTGIHSDADMMVYFPESGVVHMGDLLICQSYPSISKNSAGYIEFLEKAIDIFPENTIFVCGHGENTNLDGLRKYRDLLKKTREIVLKALKEGKKKDELIKENILAEYETFHKIIYQLGPDYWINAISKDIP